MKTLTYQQRIGLVLRHIESHLDTRPDLEELARIACFSPFHFHRIFSAMVGESVAAYVRRLLMERAAMQLGHSPETITQIALGAGYESVDAFTRAFRSHFGVLPSEYRKKDVCLQRARSLNPERPLFYHELPGLAPMHVRVEKFPPRPVAAVRYTGPYDDCCPAWERLCGAMGRNGLIRGPLLAYGVSYDNPDITPKEKCRMDVCLGLPDGVAEESPEVCALLRDEAIFLRRIGDDCDYAVMRVKGPYDLLHPAYRSLFGMWFPQSGREPTNDPGFEIYHNSPQGTAPEDLVSEICIPLRPQG